MRVAYSEAEYLPPDECYGAVRRFRGADEPLVVMPQNRESSGDCFNGNLVHKPVVTSNVNWKAESECHRLISITILVI